MSLFKPYINEYVNTLINVQHAICAGDDDLACKLCDESLYIANQLQSSEVYLMQGVSNDLEMLCDEEVLQNQDRPINEYFKDFADAWKNIENDPIRTLELLRKDQNVISRDKVAYARARAYSLLGFDQLFTQFISCAVRLAPNENNYKIFAIQALQRNDQFYEAWNIALGIFDQDNSTGTEIVYAAGAIFMGTRYMHNDQRRPVLGRLRQEILRVLNGSDDSYAVDFGLFLLAHIYEFLNRRARAEEIYKRMIKQNPQNGETILSYALFVHKSSPVASVPYFRQALELGNSSPVAYMALAMDAINKEEFDESERLARILISSDYSPRIVGQGYELLAISQVGLTGPSNEALSNLEKAKELSPESLTVNENYNKLVGMMSFPHDSNLIWPTQRSETIRNLMTNVSLLYPAPKLFEGRALSNMMNQDLAFAA